MGESYAYMGLDTCAGCGMCSTACPVGIDTGDLTRRLRGRQLGDTARSLHQWSSEHFGTFSSLGRTGLKIGHAVSGILGDNLVSRVTGGAWRKAMPPAAKAPIPRTSKGDPVVYFPTCGARIFGPTDGADKQLGDVVQELLVRAGFAPILPEGFDKLCCGQMLASKGMLEEAEDMSNRLEAALMKASDNGRIPVIMDASACSARMHKHLAGKLKLYDFHEFAHDALLPRLMITKQPGPVALHVNCSVKRTGADGKLRTLLKACVNEVIEPSAVSCCGFGGDRGFAVPELNQHALRHIHNELPAGCACGVSTNRTCEIGLTAETGLTYRSVAYLLEACSRKEDVMSC
jgi:D-lactate dehydrogenase